MVPVLELKNLDKRFGGLHVTRNVNMTISEGEISAIIGPNGAGKTTLFNLITGLIKPDSGSVVYQGTDITGRQPERIVSMGLVKAFQVASLFQDKTVYNNVYMSTLSHFKKNWQLLSGRKPSKELGEHTELILSTMGLLGKHDVSAFELSHGEQKVLDIAISLALKPNLLLLDEPTAGMSPDERVRMRLLLRKLHERFQVTTIFIEHDMDMVLGIAQLVRVLVHGQLIAEGTPQEVMMDDAVIEAYLGREIL